MPYKINAGQWMAQVTIEGKKHRHRCKTKKEATLWEVEKKEQLENGKEACSAIRTVSLHEWATAYLDYAKDRFVKKTYQEKLLAFRELFKSLASEELDILAFSGNEALRFLSAQDKGSGGNAANKRRKNLSAGWEWGIKFIGLPKENPFKAVQRFAEVRTPRIVPHLKDFFTVLSLVKSNQDRCLLLTALYTGARRDELFRLKWEDVNFKERCVRLRWRKNQAGEWKEAWLPMADDLEQELRKQRLVTGFLSNVFMVQSQGGKWVPYQYRQNFMRNLCKQAGIERFGFHGIRHLFSSILASKNVPLVEIQKMLRHGSIQTTAKYIHSLQKTGSREAIEALPKLAESAG